MRKILVLGLNHNQLSYIKELKQLGYFLIGTDLNKEAPAVLYVDKFYKCGYTDFDTLLEIGKKEQFSAKDKVFTASAQFAHIGASFFANHFHINYPKQSDIELCLDKSKYYTYFQNHNIPIPQTWYVEIETELKKILKKESLEKSYYLKSDNSKNPKYVYNFQNKDFETMQINWKKDRYFQKYYILQEEFYGEHIRVNIFGDKFSVFHFDSEKLYDDKSKQINLVKKSKLLPTLVKFLKNIHMVHWLIKFDVIINKDFKFVVLDIGMDPPYRMRKYYNSKNEDFIKMYCELYLENHNNFTLYDGNLDD